MFLDKCTVKFIGIMLIIVMTIMYARYEHYFICIKQPIKTLVTETKNEISLISRKYFEGCFVRSGNVVAAVLRYIQTHNLGPKINDLITGAKDRKVYLYN